MARLEYVIGFLIIVVMVVFFNYASEYVSGSLEVEWAYEGFTVTNFNVRMLLLFGIAGGGISWLVYKYAKRNRLVSAFMSSLMIALAMTTNEILMLLIPILVLFVIASLKLGLPKKLTRGGA